MKRLRCTVALVAAALLLAGCGEITNTVTPRPGSANLVTVALDAPPNFSHVGIFDAQALGYFAQTDLKVRFIVSEDPERVLESGRAQIAISNEPAMLLIRNRHIALASVAAILQSPTRVIVACRRVSGPGATQTSGSHATTTATATTPVSRLHPPLHPPRCTTSLQKQPEAAYAKAPTYNGLDFVVTEHEIIANAPILRRFVQAVARGYAAAKANPEAATENLVKLNPGLDYTQELLGVRASLANFFPTGSAANRPWGWQVVRDWNAFGAWMYTHHRITDADAIPDADTNELLAGQGV
jgi:putative hydroxymethylpyrimidine transport system substrate-binding protein